MADTTNSLRAHRPKARPADYATRNFPPSYFSSGKDEGHDIDAHTATFRPCDEKHPVFYLVTKDASTKDGTQTPAELPSTSETSETGMPCTTCSDKDVQIKNLKVDIHLAEKTIAMCHDDDEQYERTIKKLVHKINKLKATLSHTQRELKYVTTKVEYGRIKRLEQQLRQAEASLAKFKASMAEPIEQVMDLQGPVESEAQLKRRVKQAVNAGQMSLEEAFEQLSVVPDDDDDEVAAEPMEINVY